MLAKELKALVEKTGPVKVTMNPNPNLEEGNLSDLGHSVSDISTYMSPGISALVVDSFRMPPLADSLDNEKLRQLLRAGTIYFVFDYRQFETENEKVANRNWGTGGPKNVWGTAIEVGCYSGFDMVGFPADTDMSKIFTFDISKVSDKA